MVANVSEISLVYPKILFTISQKNNNLIQNLGINGTAAKYLYFQLLVNAQIERFFSFFLSN